MKKPVWLLVCNGRDDIEQAPALVDRAELAACGHASAVRVFLYEKDCES